MSKMPSQSSKIPLSLLLLIFISIPFQVNSVHTQNTERTILLSMKQQWGNPPSIQYSWNSSSSPCGWPEIQCTNGTVTGISLPYKKINKKVPPSICDLKNLKELDISYNNIPGGFPITLYDCSKLEYLDLSQNLFVGPIPDDIYRMSSLRYLNLNSNEFNNVPPELGRLKKLKYLSIMDSNLTGRIPETIADLSSLEQLDLSMNQLKGSIPGGLFRLKNLRYLDLNHNQLSGDIPTPVEALSLVEINLSHNHLTGSIPEGFGQLHYLDSIDLSQNQLSGRVPHELETKRSSYYIFSFSHNSNLCADYPCHRYGCQQLPSCKSKTRVIVMVVAPIGCLLIGLSIFFLSRHCRRRKQQDQSTDVSGWKLIWFHRLEFTESDILSCLTENNLIGSGGSGKVYLIVINPTGRRVAVKRVCNHRKLDHRLDREFLAEVQILGMIRHSNIVKLLCCISNEVSKLLVYEYMENQSLDRWLHGKQRSASSVTADSVQNVVLDWPMRLQIAIGAAQGLCYMHHDCSPPIIHRDIKSSNILLDSKFEARIADFGLARMLAKRGEPETASAVAGTFGYIAPEYAYTAKVNVKSDIYSFGVVLLELATGREPINVDECMNLAEWSWQHYEEGNSIADALDEDIKEPCYLQEMTAMFKLGLMCTATSPSTRPSMKEVLEILECCANNLSS